MNDEYGCEGKNKTKTNKFKKKWDSTKYLSKPKKKERARPRSLTLFPICGLLVDYGSYFFLASARAINFSISRPSAVVGYFSLISVYADKADAASPCFSLNMA